MLCTLKIACHVYWHCCTKSVLWKVAYYFGNSNCVHKPLRIPTVAKYCPVQAHTEKKTVCPKLVIFLALYFTNSYLVYSHLHSEKFLWNQEQYHEDHQILIHSLQHSSSREADSSSAMFRHLWSPKVHYCIRHSSPPDPIMTKRIRLFNC